jgi:hypothetical protein
MPDLARTGRWRPRVQVIGGPVVRRLHIGNQAGVVTLTVHHGRRHSGAPQRKRTRNPVIFASVTGFRVLDLGLRPLSRPGMTDTNVRVRTLAGLCEQTWITYAYYSAAERRVTESRLDSYLAIL